MNAKELRIIEARIKEELSNMSQLLSELEKRNLVVKGYGRHRKISLPEDTFVLRAIGSILHDFYVATENVFEVIAREIDEHIPDGLDWHIQLLQQMALDVTDVRIAVISKNSLIRLDKYRAFRHVFRNVYGFNIDASRLNDLINDLPDTIKQFQQDIALFIDYFKKIIE